MAVPTFVGAGTGAERTTAGTFTVSKTGCTAGNVVCFDMKVQADTGDWGGFSNRVNVQDFSGVGGALDFVENTGNRQWAWGRVTANGTVSADLTVGASGEDIAARIYEFSGVTTATTPAGVLQHGGGLDSETAGTSTTVSAPDVTTLGADRLACAFVAIRAVRTIGSFTGETGGDWTEAVAEYQGTTITLQLQTASLASAGTITGGSISITSANWQVFGTSLIPFVAGTPSGNAATMMLMGVG